MSETLPRLEPPARFEMLCCRSIVRSWLCRVVVSVGNDERKKGGKEKSRVVLICRNVF